jgi:hypothetical protein
MDEWLAISGRTPWRPEITAQAWVSGTSVK